jgi:hypothetical protein
MAIVDEFTPALRLKGAYASAAFVAAAFSRTEITSATGLEQPEYACILFWGGLHTPHWIGI